MIAKRIVEQALAEALKTGGDFAELRRAMLREEGVTFLRDGRVDMENCRWQPERAAD